MTLRLKLKLNSFVDSLMKLQSSSNFIDGCETTGLSKLISDIKQAVELNELMCQVGDEKLLKRINELVTYAISITATGQFSSFISKEYTRLFESTGLTDTKDHTYPLL